MTLSVMATQEALHGPTGAMLREACSIAQAMMLPLDGGPGPQDGIPQDSILVDVLPRGERSVPRVARQALRAGRSVVLLAGESLSQPLVPLHEGLLHVLDGSSSALALAHGLRSAAAQRGAGTSDETRDAEVGVREVWSPGSYAGVAWRGATPAGALRAEAEQVHASLASGDDAAAAVLDLRRAMWSLRALANAEAAWLLSGQRLPPRYDLRQGPASLAASRGDVVVLGDFPLSNEAVAELGTEVGRRGSPHALRCLSRLVTQQPGAALAMLVEAI